MAKAKKVHLLVGTYKGAFVFVSDRARKHWTIKGPFLKGSEVNDIILDARSTPAMYACANSSWFGPGFKISVDGGKTWADSQSGIRFEEGSDRKVERVWTVVPGTADEPDVLYAGADPGALFRSEDRGNTWTEMTALSRHPTRQKWSPGAGGLMVHSICGNPKNPKEMYVGISAAGVFHTSDGGKTWEARNKGVLADFNPEKFPEVGQCVHHLEMHPENPNVLYQQNHCGVYRTENGGKDWIDINKGLPSRFGFPIIVHPNDPDTIYVIPEEGAEFRSVSNASFGIYRSRNKGGSWKKLTKGLPAKNAYVHVYRQATAADTLDKAGLYVGTSNGQIYSSTNDGESWKPLAENLPPVYSLSVTVA